ncbi:MAG: HupE/UreJ family protein [Gemmatimonadetes bacterium]|nr:HupE/UreJ family protein [Gemmatimonadota bacterium]
MGLPSVTPGRAPARLLRSALLAVLLLAALPGRPAAHEIPNDVLVRLFVRPDGAWLHVLVRTPLEAMRDFVFPLRGPGYLDLEQVDPLLREAAQLWVSDYLRFYEDGRQLPGAELESVRISLPSDPSFASWERARAHFDAAPLPASTELPWQQAAFDMRFRVPISSDTAAFALDSRLAHLGLRTVTVLRFAPPDGPERIFEFTGDPGRVRLDPRWYHAAARFVALGVEHILDGIDHLLFLLCLVVPLRSVRALVPVVTAFTVAHSITLFAAALGLAPDALWFPPLIETLIALSIVYMAFENIVGARQERRWWMAFGFGLVHGFGFSFVLAETLQFAGGHLLTSLLAFNVGVELGQVLVLVVTVPVLAWLFRRVVKERMGVILLSALIAHTGWHWMTERGSTFLEYPLTWPVLDAAFLGMLARWSALAAVVAAAGWGLRAALLRWDARRPRESTPATG